MNPWALLIVLAASVLAILLVYSASSYQRSLRRPLEAFPTRVSAGLVALVALRGWIEAIGPVAGMLLWLASVCLVAALDHWLTVRARTSGRREMDAAGFHSWNAR